MNKCGTCRFWGRAQDAGLNYRPCQAAIHDKDFKYCDKEWDDEEDRLERAEKLKTLPLRLAVVEDGSGWHAALKCREDFGCVLHEERPSEA